MRVYEGQLPGGLSLEWSSVVTQTDRCWKRSGRRQPSLKLPRHRLPSTTG